MATSFSVRYNRDVPARPLVFALGLLVCLAGAITCATAAPDDPHAFPSLSDLLLLGGLALVVVGVAGRDPRGRQLLGHRPRSRKGSAPPPSRDPSPPPGDPPA